MPALSLILSCQRPGIEPGTVADPEIFLVAGEGPVDVVIVGAGPAGLAAALEVVDAGGTVQILEREADFGGSANWSGGLMLFSGTSLQAELGVDDSPTRLLEEWPCFTGGDPTDAWVSAFANQNVVMVHDWLVGLGVTFAGIGSDPSSGPTARVHNVEGRGVALVAALEAPLDGGSFRYRAEARELLRDEAGRVTGVRWQDLDADAEHLTSARTVIVATGGFMHDLARVREERPDLAERDLRFGSWPGADGAGLTMVEAVGGATQNLGALGIYAHGVPAPGDEGGELVSNTLGNLPWFNIDGERFVDESASNAFPTGAIRAAQPDGDAWALFDSSIAGSTTFQASGPDGALVTFRELDEAGMVVMGEDLDEVAAALGVPAEPLSAEVGAYNAFASGTVAQDAFRTERASAHAVTAPPYYAVPVAISVAKGFGGVDVDLSGRVLDIAGVPIPGLYAAGELTGMAGGTLVGDYGFTGSLSAVVLGGRIAGSSAVDEALAE